MHQIFIACTHTLIEFTYILHILTHNTQECSHGRRPRSADPPDCVDLQATSDRVQDPGQHCQAGPEARRWPGETETAVLGKTPRGMLNIKMFLN